MTTGERQQANPAERKGVKVYRPKALPNTSYEGGSLIDLDTGDKLVAKSGHAGGIGTFGLSNTTSGPIAGGGFRTWSSKGLNVFEVTWIRTTVGGIRAYRAREEYDILRIAEMFRALDEERVRKARPVVGNIAFNDVIVVDARPEKVSDIDPHTGQPRGSK